MNGQWRTDPACPSGGATGDTAVPSPGRVAHSSRGSHTLRGTKSTIAWAYVIGDTRNSFLLTSSDAGRQRGLAMVTPLGLSFFHNRGSLQWFSGDNEGTYVCDVPWTSSRSGRLGTRDNEMMRQRWGEARFCRLENHRNPWLGYYIYRAFRFLTCAETSLTWSYLQFGSNLILLEGFGKGKSLSQRTAFWVVLTRPG
jgi:hypothetical protein